MKHQDIGQMQMFVNYYDREIKMEDENKTIGLILCQNKSEAVVNILFLKIMNKYLQVNTKQYYQQKNNY